MGGDKGVNGIEKEIGLIDEEKNLQISYTCMTDALKLGFVLRDFELADTDEVQLYIQGKDDLISIEATKDLQKGSIEVDIPSNCFPSAGETQGQIRIARDGKRLYSNRIRMNIHPYYGGA